jgi:hypothetical protein
VLPFQAYLQEVSIKGAARIGAVTAFASKSKTWGDKANSEYANAKQVLSTPNVPLPVNKRLNKIERALDKLLSGLQATRQQIGSGVSTTASSAVLGTKLLSKRGRRR